MKISCYFILSLSTIDPHEIMFIAVTTEDIIMIISNFLPRAVFINVSLLFFPIHPIHNFKPLIFRSANDLRNHWGTVVFMYICKRTVNIAVMTVITSSLLGATIFSMSSVTTFCSCHNFQKTIWDNLMIYFRDIFFFKKEHNDELAVSWACQSSIIEDRHRIGGANHLILNLLKFNFNWCIIQYMTCLVYN